jgi:hypothetical protein
MAGVIIAYYSPNRMGTCAKLKTGRKEDRMHAFGSRQHAYASASTWSSHYRQEGYVEINALFTFSVTVLRKLWQPIMIMIMI